MTKQSLKASSHTVSDIVALLKPILDKCSTKQFMREKFSSATTLANLFIVLQTYVLWFNYEFIVKLANVFLPCVCSLKKKWSKYCRKLKDYFTSNNDVAIKCADGI